MEPAKFQYLSFSVVLSGDEINNGDKKKEELIVLNVIPHQHAFHYVKNEEVILILDYLTIDAILDVSPNEFVIKASSKGRKQALKHRCPSHQDKRTLMALLKKAKGGALQEKNALVFPTPLREGVCKKKGKLRRTERYLILVKGRLLVCQKYSSKYPIASVYLTKAKISSTGKSSLMIQVGGDRFEYAFSAKDEKDAWLGALQLEAGKAARRNPDDTSFFVELREPEEKKNAVASPAAPSSTGAPPKGGLDPRLASPFDDDDELSRSELHIFVEGVAKSIGYIEIEGTGATLADIREVVCKLERAPASFAFLRPPKDDVIPKAAEANHQAADYVPRIVITDLTKSKSELSPPDAQRSGARLSISAARAPTAASGGGGDGSGGTQKQPSVSSSQAPAPDDGATDDSKNTDNPDDESRMLNIFIEGDTEVVVGVVEVAEADLAGATLADVREVCGQLPDIPTHFAILKRRDPNSVSPPSKADEIRVSQEVLTLAVDFYPEGITLRPLDEEPRNSQSEISPDSAMLNIFVEGIEESVGAIEISGEGATLTDIRGVCTQLQEVQGDFSFVVDGKRVALAAESGMAALSCVPRVDIVLGSNPAAGTVGQGLPLPPPSSRSSATNASASTSAAGGEGTDEGTGGGDEDGEVLLNLWLEGASESSGAVEISAEGASLSDIREVCSQLPDVGSRRFVFVRDGDKVVREADEAGIQALDCCPKIFLRFVDGDGGDEEEEVRSLEIRLEGESEAVGTIEISGSEEDATLADIREVCDQLPHKPDVFVFVVDGGRTEVARSRESQITAAECLPTILLRDKAPSKKSKASGGLPPPPTAKSGKDSASLFPEADEALKKLKQKSALIEADPELAKKHQPLASAPLLDELANKLPVPSAMATASSPAAKSPGDTTSPPKPDRSVPSPPPPAASSTDGAAATSIVFGELKIFLEGAVEPVGSVEIDEESQDATLEDIRSVCEQLDSLPKDFSFVVNNNPVLSKQEAKVLAHTCLPKVFVRAALLPSAKGLQDVRDKLARAPTGADKTPPKLSPPSEFEEVEQKHNTMPKPNHAPTASISAGRAPKPKSGSSAVPPPPLEDKSSAVPPPPIEDDSAAVPPPPIEDDDDDDSDVPLAEIALRESNSAQAKPGVAGTGTPSTLGVPGTGSQNDDQNGRRPSRSRKLSTTASNSNVSSSGPGELVNYPESRSLHVYIEGETESPGAIDLSDEADADATLEDVREACLEMNGIPSNFIFVRNGIPVGRKQERKTLAISCLPRLDVRDAAKMKALARTPTSPTAATNVSTAPKLPPSSTAPAPTPTGPSGSSTPTSPSSATSASTSVRPSFSVMAPPPAAATVTTSRSASPSPRASVSTLNNVGASRQPQSAAKKQVSPAPASTFNIGGNSAGAPNGSPGSSGRSTPVSSRGHSYSPSISRASRTSISLREHFEKKRAEEAKSKSQPPVASSSPTSAKATNSVKPPAAKPDPVITAASSSRMPPPTRALPSPTRTLPPMPPSHPNSTTPMRTESVAPPPQFFPPPPASVPSSAPPPVAAPPTSLPPTEIGRRVERSDALASPKAKFPPAPSAAFDSDESRGSAVPVVVMFKDRNVGTVDIDLTGNDGMTIGQLRSKIAALNLPSLASAAFAFVVQEKILKPNQEALLSAQVAVDYNGPGAEPRVLLIPEPLNHRVKLAQAKGGKPTVLFICREDRGTKPIGVIDLGQMSAVGATLKDVRGIVEAQLRGAPKNFLFVYDGRSIMRENEALIPAVEKLPRVFLRDMDSIKHARSGSSLHAVEPSPVALVRGSVSQATQAALGGYGSNHAAYGAPRAMNSHARSPSLRPPVKRTLPPAPGLSSTKLSIYVFANGRKSEQAVVTADLSGPSAKATLADIRLSISPSGAVPKDFSFLGRTGEPIPRSSEARHKARDYLPTVTIRASQPTLGSQSFGTSNVVAGAAGAMSIEVVLQGHGALGKIQINADRGRDQTMLADVRKVIAFISTVPERFEFLEPDNPNRGVPQFQEGSYAAHRMYPAINIRDRSKRGGGAGGGGGGGYRPATRALPQFIPQ